MFEQLTGLVTQNVTTAGYDPAAMAGLGAMIAGLIVFSIIASVVIYVYYGITVMFTAKKLSVEPSWLAWIPIANLVLMAKMAKMHWWPVLLVIGFIIPFVNFVAVIMLLVYYIIWLWKICEERGKEGWLAVLIIVPGLGALWNLVLWGILAWDK
jgi:uncharacterized membrane protein YphA (DoxX/SURF4 family)